MSCQSNFCVLGRVLGLMFMKERKNEQSRADFCSKMNIALKEATESNYWIDLLREAEYISESEYKSLSDDCHKIQAVLTKIVKATRSSLNQ